MADYGVRADEEQAAAKAMTMKKAREARKLKKSKGKHKPRTQDSTHADDDGPCPTPTPAAIMGGPASPPKNAEIHPTGHVQFAIDPRLLDLEPRPSAAQTAAIDTVPAPNRILINATEMQQLNDMGYPSSLPVNGPNDGLPMYAVPATATTILAQGSLRHSTLTAQTLGQDGSRNMDSQPSPRRVSPRKKTLTADARTVQEGQKLLNGDSKAARRVTRRR
jgi:hypothetical protein